MAKDVNTVMITAADSLDIVDVVCVIHRLCAVVHQVYQHS